MFFQVLELEIHGKEHVLCTSEVDVNNVIKRNIRICAWYTRYWGDIIASMGFERCAGGMLM